MLNLSVIELAKLIEIIGYRMEEPIFQSERDILEIVLNKLQIEKEQL